MSSDIYIPIRVVLSHPHLFKLDFDSIGDMHDCRLELEEDTPNHGAIHRWLQPTMICKFGARESWREVEVYLEGCEIEDYDEEGNYSPKLGYECVLHISCGGEFRSWLLKWLDSHGLEHDFDFHLNDIIFNP